MQAPTSSFAKLAGRCGPRCSSRRSRRILSSDMSLGPLHDLECDPERASAVVPAHRHRRVTLHRGNEALQLAHAGLQFGGARLVVDPWDGRLELLRSAAALPGSLREKAPLGITPLTPHLRYPGETAPPLQTRAAPQAAASAAPIVEAAAPTVPSMRDVDLSGPESSAPQVPSLAPVPEAILPPSGGMVPASRPVPSLEALPGGDAAVPSVQEVPQVVPVEDRCAAEGTDAACSR